MTLGPGHAPRSPRPRTDRGAASATPPVTDLNATASTTSDKPGNQAVGALFQTGLDRTSAAAAMAKPTHIGADHDAAESAADLAASNITARPSPAERATPSLATLPSADVGAGRPLDPVVRSRYESALGVDLSTVAIHTDDRAAAAARQAGAAAYTVGPHIVFGRLSYSPDSSYGAWLLAHELVHTLQPGRTPVLRRSPVPAAMLDQQLYDALRRKDYAAAAEVLNGFSAEDIGVRLSRAPGAGRRVLTAAEVTALHAAAVKHPRLGPNSNVVLLTPGGGSVDWRVVVPDATDRVTSALDAGRKHQRLVHHVTGPAPTPAGTDAAHQRSIDAAVAQVAAYRASLPAPEATTGITSSQGATWAGTSWTRFTPMRRFRPPKPTKKNPKPKDARSDAQRAEYDSAVDYQDWMSATEKAIGTMAMPAAGTDLTKYKQWLGNRLFFDIGGKEGGFDSINVYDKQIVTWGAGLGGASGNVSGTLEAVTNSTSQAGPTTVGAAVTSALHAAGIDVVGRQFIVLDVATQRVYRGTNALHVIKSDNRLLYLLTLISRGQIPGVDTKVVPTGTDSKPTGPALQTAMRTATFDAQRDFFLHTYGGAAAHFQKAIDDLGPTWPKDSLEMVLHMQWWGLASWPAYKATGGDMKAIIEKSYSFNKYVQDRNGAHIAVRDLADHLVTFGGSTSRARWGPPTQLEDAQLTKGSYYLEVKPGGGKQAPTYRELR